MINQFLIWFWKERKRVITYKKMPFEDFVIKRPIYTDWKGPKCATSLYASSLRKQDDGVFTPGHLLAGRHLLALPELSSKQIELPTKNLTSTILDYQLMMNSFWKYIRDGPFFHRAFFVRKSFWVISCNRKFLRGHRDGSRPWRGLGSGGIRRRAW